MKVHLAVLNVMFVALGAVLGIIDDPTPEGVFWNLTYLGSVKEGVITLYTGRQTPGLVAGKKLDAIARSMPSTVIQLYALILDRDILSPGEYTTFVVSIGLAILGSSVTLAGLHPRAGHRVASKQFVVVLTFVFGALCIRAPMALAL